QDRKGGAHGEGDRRERDRDMSGEAGAYRTTHCRTLATSERKTVETLSRQLRHRPSGGIGMLRFGIRAALPDRPEPADRFGGTRLAADVGAEDRDDVTAGAEGGAGRAALAGDEGADAIPFGKTQQDLLARIEAARIAGAPVRMLEIEVRSRIDRFGAAHADQVPADELGA